MSSLFVQGIIDDTIALNNAVFTGSCTIYPFTVVSNGQGGTTAGFGTPIYNVPCRLDDSMTNLLPQRAKEDIDVQKVERDIYLPVGTPIHIKDELETKEGDPDGSVVRYRVLDLAIETDQTDIGVLVEVVE